MSPTFNPMKLYHRRCRETRAQMSDLIDGELDERTAAAVARHARWCPNCRRMLKNLSRTVTGLHDIGEAPTPVDSPQR
ncbi:MAG TPA: zf-HC2 domain-containing protein [Solirubrobacterales bacterium]